jgi:hypothetical protein
MDAYLRFFNWRRRLPLPPSRIPRRDAGPLQDLLTRELEKRSEAGMLIPVMRVSLVSIVLTS